MGALIFLKDGAFLLKYVIFHHDDLDGLCSGAIIKNYLIKTHGEAIESNLFTFVCDYDRNAQMKNIEEANIEEDSVVYVVDFCFDDDLMEMLIHKVHHNNFIWIDHHSTAIKRMKEFKFEGVQDTRYSATMLAWIYANGETNIPLVVQYIDTFDCWKKDNDNKWNNVIMPFKYALESKCIDLNDDDNIWNTLFKNDLEDIKKLILEGTIIKGYMEQRFIEDAKQKAYTIPFEGVRALCINSYGYGSLVLEAMFDPEEHDIMLTFAISKNRKVNVGLYTPKKDIHVGKLAQKYGGGGHPGAAGFMLDVSQIDIVSPWKQED